MSHICIYRHLYAHYFSFRTKQYMIFCICPLLLFFNMLCHIWQRIDAFELWCWRRLLRVLWTARRSKQSTPKEIRPEYSLEGLLLKLILQYFGHLMRRTDSMEKTLMLGKIEGRRRGQQDEMVGWHHWLDGHEFEQALGVGDRQGSLVCCGSWGHKELHTTEGPNWTDWKTKPRECV